MKRTIPACPALRHQRKIKHFFRHGVRRSFREVMNDFRYQNSRYPRRRPKSCEGSPRSSP
jgi:hypothetical protein